MAPALSGPDPSEVHPSKNTTLPVGVPPVPVTVAVNVTVWPKADGFGAALIAVVVLAPALARSGTRRLAMGVPRPVTRS